MKRIDTILSLILLGLLIVLGIMILQSRTTTAKVYRMGYIDKTCQLIIEPRFKLADMFSDGLAAVRVVGGGRRIKYIDRTGRIVIDSREGIFHVSDNTIPLYPLFTFKEGVRRFRSSNGKFGFMGEDGEIIINPIFDWASSFSESLSAVKVGKLWGYINKTGEFVIDLKFDNYPGSFSEGLAYVVLDGKYGYIDKQGTIVIEPRFDSAYPFSEGLAAVEIDGKWGYIDKNGKFVITPKFDEWLGFFKEGRTIVAIDSEWQVIDRTGRIVVEAGKYSYCRESGFSEGLSVVKDISDMYGFINTEGKLVIGFNFGYAYPFSESLAAVEVSGKWGFINKNGSFVIKPQFPYVASFSEGLANVGVVVPTKNSMQP